MKPFSALPDIIKEIKNSRPVIVVDGPRRENEGDFFFPAQNITPQKVNFMITYGKGLLCAAMEESQAKRLKLSLMIPRHKNTEQTGVNFTVSFNARRKTTSGVSAFDRATTIKLLTNPKAQANNFTRPGHVLGLIAHKGGLHKRPGHTEAAVALAKLAGFAPVGVLCEIIKSDGRMARLPDLKRLAKKFQIKMVFIEELKKYLTNK